MNKQAQTALLVWGILASIAIATFQAPKALADCATPYGPYGTQNCPPENDLKVDKKVKNPITGVFVDNLGSGDASYSPKSEVIYSLKISNTGSHDFSTVSVTDTLPEQLNQGKVVDSGSVIEESDSDTTVSFKIKDLKAGESREIQVKAVVKDMSAQDKVCGVKNKVRVEAEGRSDEDTAEPCIQTNVLGKTTLPQAGVADYLPLVPFLGLAITGMMLVFKRA